MRENMGLYRGKRKDNGEWVCGNLFIDEQGDKHEILVGYVNYRIGWEVAPETVGQYTGLRDCKRTEEYPEGQMIFEGDILRVDDIENAFVRYGRHAQFEVEFDSSVCDFALLYQYNHSSKVVGNVWDNPELLQNT